MFCVRDRGPAVKGWLGLYCSGASSVRRQSLCVLWTFWTRTWRVVHRKPGSGQLTEKATLKLRPNRQRTLAQLGRVLHMGGDSMQTLLEWKQSGMEWMSPGKEGLERQSGTPRSGRENHSKGSGHQGLKGGIEWKSWEVMIFVALCNTATEKCLRFHT